MKNTNFIYLLAAMGLVGSAIQAKAQTPAPTPFDVHPYQSQTTIRIVANGLLNGTIQVIPAVTVPEYKYWVIGVQGQQSAFNAALLYDKRNPLPKISVSGGNFNFYEGGYMTTTSADGFFNYKGKSFFTPATIGGTYFTKAGTNELVVVDSYGYFWDTFTPTSPIRLAGGNFFIDHDGVLTTIKSSGVAAGNGTGMVTSMADVKETVNGHVRPVRFSDAFIAGGNYFVKTDGSIVTISSKTGFYSAPYVTDTRPKLLGGNYFIGLDNLIYTIDADGNLKKNTAYQVPTVPSLMAYSFMRFQDGSLMMVDGDGFVHKSLVNVSTTGLTVQELKTWTTNIDPTSIYLPGKRL